LEIKNTGKTAAFITEFRQLLITDKILSDGLQPRNAGVRGAVSPGEVRHIELDFGKPPDLDSAMVNNGTLRLWILGSIVYSNRLSFLAGTNKTGFCFFYDPSRGRGSDSFYHCQRPEYEYND